MTDDLTPSGRFTRVISTCAATADLATVTARLADVAALQRWMQAREIDLTIRLAELADQPGGPDPDAEHAKATNRSNQAAGTARRRAQASKQAPAIKDEIDHGRLSGEHLDAFTAAVAGLPAALRPVLVAMQDELAAEAVARQLTVEAFRDRLRAVVRDIEADDGRDRLARQKRDTSLRMWTDKNTGMGCLSGRFDPETFMVLQQRIADQLEARFRQERPTDCPDDPLQAQDWLRAHAVADLICGGGAGVGKPEIIIVIDHDTYLHGRHAQSRVDCGPGIDIPIETIRGIGGIGGIGGRARFIPIIIDTHGVAIREGTPVATIDELADSLTRPVPLDRGRTCRHADRNQRRALRAMYRTCAIPGCQRHVSITEPHHIRHWEHRGPTDLHNLLPLCKHHHDRSHTEHWDIQMQPDRSLTVTRNGTTLMTTGPPRHQWA
jgi:hypothetical protein